MALLDIFKKTLPEVIKENEEAALEEAKATKSQQEELMRHAQESNIDDFIFEFDQIYNSAIGAWGSTEQQKDLKRLYKMGAKFVIITGEGNTATRRKITKQSQESGWTLFAEVDNYDSLEAIFFHK